MTGSAVPSRVSLLISIIRLNLALTYGILPEFRGGVHLFIYNRHTPSGHSCSSSINSINSYFGTWYEIVEEFHILSFFADFSRAQYRILRSIRSASKPTERIMQGKQVVSSLSRVLYKYSGWMIVVEGVDFFLFELEGNITYFK